MINIDSGKTNGKEDIKNAYNQVQEEGFCRSLIIVR